MMIRPQVFLDVYGEDWGPIVEVLPVFEE